MAGNNKKLRVIVLTYNNLYSNPLFTPLLGKSFINIAAIIDSDTLKYKKNIFASLWFFFRKNGLFYFSFKVFDQGLYMITEKIRNLIGGKGDTFIGQAKKRGIPVIKLKDINSDEAIGLLKSYKADFLLSYFNQILKKEILAVPKRGCINIHPGYLPQYRGLASSFWAMESGGKFGGATVHFMAEKVDEGDIILREKVPVSDDISLQEHNYLCCSAGGELILETLEMISKNKLVRTKQRSGRYYSWPNSNNVKSFSQKGFKLMTLKDLGLYFS